uniref:Uncharacterized protein n=1 Tax=Panagrolaimus sp. PS1159 TaxID=55785 RepID=A0AC35F9W5_9BILA
MTDQKPKRSYIRPDYDTDVLWRPMRPMMTRTRTISTDSADSEITASSPRERRFSITGMLMGGVSGIGGLGMVRQSSVNSDVVVAPPPKKFSMTEHVDLKEFMRRQNRALSDDDGFRSKDYTAQK